MAGCSGILPGTSLPGASCGTGRPLTEALKRSFFCNGDLDGLHVQLTEIPAKPYTMSMPRSQLVQTGAAARCQASRACSRQFASRRDGTHRGQQIQAGPVAGSRLRSANFLSRCGTSRSATTVPALPSSIFFDLFRSRSPGRAVPNPSPRDQDLESRYEEEQAGELAEAARGPSDNVWFGVQGQRGDPWGEQEKDGSLTGTSSDWSTKRSSSLFTTLLVNYSLLVSDWWQFKHTAKDRLLDTLLSSPVTQTVSRVAVPVAATVGMLSSPVTETVSKIDIRQAGGFFDRFRRKGDAAVGESSETVVPKTREWEGDEGASSSGEEVTSVTRDDVNPGILWERRRKDVEAEERRGPMTSPGFSYSAAGLLFPYHLGATQCLMDAGYIKENTPLAGSSAGAIVCAVVASGLDMQQALAATKDLAADCRQNGTAFRLGFVLRRFLEQFLPEDAHERASGRIRVAVTQVFPSPRGLLVDSFDSKEDLINCLITSSFVPGFLAPAPVTWFRDRYCVDGGLSLFMPPTASEETVRICAFPASSFGLSGIGISPDLNAENRATTRQLFNWALEPAEDHILDKLFEQGYQDTLIWVQQNANKGSRLLVS